MTQSGETAVKTKRQTAVKDKNGEPRKGPEKVQAEQAAAQHPRRLLPRARGPGTRRVRTLVLP